jgi:hypothetical protein
MRTIQFLAGVTVLACAASLSVAAGGTVVDAVKSGDRQEVRLLIKQHANVNTPEADGTTALHWAARQDDLETASMFLRKAKRPS